METTRKTRVIVDAFGGDNAPLEPLKGAAMAVAEYGVQVTLVGNEETLRALATEHSISLDGIDIVHTDSVIPMEEHPRAILKAYKDCSMAVGLRALAVGEGDAFVSAGSTGALLMGATFLVKRIKGVSRPALASIVPGDEGPFMLIDCGANVECRPEMLLQFAHMASVYMIDVIGMPADEVTVGMVNVGAEETKGGAFQLETYELLKNSDLNFIGNVEAREIPTGHTKVVVTDGFTGNVIIKLMEGTIAALMGNIKRLFYKNFLTKLAGAIVKPQLGAFKAKMSVDEYGGAPLLGVAAPVIKAHGNSKAYAFKNAIRVAAGMAEAGVVDKLAGLMRKGEDADE